MSAPALLQDEIDHDGTVEGMIQAIKRKAEQQGLVLEMVRLSLGDHARLHSEIFYSQPWGSLFERSGVTIAHGDEQDGRPACWFRPGPHHKRLSTKLAPGFAHVQPADIAPSLVADMARKVDQRIIDVWYADTVKHMEGKNA